MPVTPWHGPDEPYETRLGHAHFANGLLVATVKLPAEPLLGPHSDKPAILFDFVEARPGQPIAKYPPFVLTFTGDDEPAGLVELVTRAVDDLERVATWQPPPPPPVTHCPGCGVKLHGAVAKRGACIACFPTIPGDDR